MEEVGRRLDAVEKIQTEGRQQSKKMQFDYHFMNERLQQVQVQTSQRIHEAQMQTKTMLDELKTGSSMLLNQIEVQAGQIEHLMSGVFNPIETRLQVGGETTDRLAESPHEDIADYRYAMEQSVEEEQLQSNDEVSFAVDDDGYLVDREGNFILDDRGDMVKLSKNELNAFVV